MFTFGQAVGIGVVAWFLGAATSYVVLVIPSPRRRRPK